jgi:hypothetical protein
LTNIDQYSECGVRRGFDVTNDEVQPELQKLLCRQEANLATARIESGAPHSEERRQAACRPGPGVSSLPCPEFLMAFGLSSSAQPPT